MASGALSVLQKIKGNDINSRSLDHSPTQVTAAYYPRCKFRHFSVVPLLEHHRELFEQYRSPASRPYPNP